MKHYKQPECKRNPFLGDVELIKSIGPAKYPKNTCQIHKPIAIPTNIQPAGHAQINANPTKIMLNLTKNAHPQSQAALTVIFSNTSNHPNGSAILDS